MISYDNAKSYRTSRAQLLVGYPLICDHKTDAKGHFIHEMGLAGFSMWETGGDSKDILVDSIRLAMHMTP